MRSLRLFKRPSLWLVLALLMVVVPHSISAQSACALPPRLTVGQRGQVIGTSPNNLRAQPARTADLIGMIDGAALFTVLAGAECDAGSGINWWQVDYNGQIGWTAEGDGQNYFVEPVNSSFLYRMDEVMTGAGDEGRADIALYDVVTGESRLLTANIPDEYSPDADWDIRLGNFAWTPQGDKIAFTLEVYEPFIQSVDETIYLMNPDGSGKCRLAENMRLVDNGLYAAEPAEPETFDGPPLNFPVCENTPAFVDAGWRFAVEPVSIGVALNRTTGERIQLSDRTLGDALYGSQVSPDQTQAALVLSDKSYNYTLYLTPLHNPQPKLVTLQEESTTTLQWSPDSQFLLVATLDIKRDSYSIIRLNVAIGEQTVIFKGVNYGDQLNGLAWSPSGARIAFSIGTIESEPRLFLVNADGSDVRQLNTDVPFGYIVWRPE